MHTARDNYSLGCAGLAAGTTSGTFKTTNALPVAIDGRAYQKAATDNVAFALMTKVPAAAITPIPASSAAVLFISMDTAGNLVYEQSPIKAGPTAAGYQSGAAEWPQETKGYACIGAIKIVTNASGAFTAATTSLGASNQTVTYYNAGDDYGVAIPF